MHKFKDLPKDTARGQSTSKFIPQAGGKSYDKTFTSRVVTSNSSAACESTNWKADYNKFKGLTFAQVVKSKSTKPISNKKLATKY